MVTSIPEKIQSPPAIATTIFESKEKTIKIESFSIPFPIVYKDLKDLFEHDPNFGEFEMLEVTPHLNKKLQKLANFIDAEKRK